MKTYFHMFKLWDLIIIFSLVLLSFLPFAIFSTNQAGKNESNSHYIAVISVNNKSVKSIMLTGNSGTEVFDIKQSNSEINTIEIKNDRIRIKAATCPDQICVKTGYISKSGQTIVCLPHKLVIEIQSINGETDDVIISS